jgi:hypothetical protein
MSPQTIELAREDWTRTLKEFSAIHEGWLVSLDILSPAMGAQPQITDLPLVGVTFEPDDGGTMTVTAASSPGDHMTHAIRLPARAWIERTDAGADIALEVESADGIKAILRFRTTALPETVDGVARWPGRQQ